MKKRSTWLWRRSRRLAFRTGRDIYLALDPAASEFYSEGESVLRSEGGAKKTHDEMIELYSNFSSKYPICSIQDGLSEEGWDGRKKLTKKMGAKYKSWGDDIFLTNTGNPCKRD